MTRLKTTYSFLGNFVQFLTLNKQRIKNMMADYKIQERADKLPDGKEATALVCTQKNIKVTFAPFRVDFEYLYLEKSNDVQQSLKAAVDFYNLLGEIFYEFKAARMAMVTTVLLNNKDKESEKVLANKFGMTSIFGDCQEFTFRINSIKDSFEKLNSILDFKPGEVFNNQTKEKVPVLVMNIDINTLHDNYEHRFNGYDAEKYFSDLVLEEQEKYNIIDSL